MNLSPGFSKHPYLFVVLATVFAAHLGSFLFLAQLAARNPDAAAYPVVRGDGETYVKLADSLIAQGGFAGSGFEEERHWPPGYPAFLALTKWVSGGLYLAVALQILAALLAVALIYAMALRFLPPLWAALPALLFGLDPSVILANMTILSDGFFASLMVGIVYLAFFADVRREWVRWGVVGLLLGLATLMRPIAQFLILLAPFFLAAHTWSHGARAARSYFVPLVAYVVAAALIVAPWLLWTHARFGVYEISHVGASNLLYYNARDFLAWKEMHAERGVPAILASRYRSDPAYGRVDARIAEELAKLTPESGSAANYEGALAVQFIMSDPLRYAYFHVVNTAPFFIGSSFAAYGQTVRQVGSNEGFYAPTALALVEQLRAARVAGSPSGFVSALLPVFPVLLEMAGWALAVLFALAALLVHRRNFFVWIFAALILYFAVLTGPVAIPRYRIPAEPLLLILAALGLYAIVHWTRAYRQKKYVGH